MIEKNPSDEASQAKAELAERLSVDPAYMANVLRTFQAQERLDADALATRLGISLNGVTHLALCKRPSSESPEFGAQVRQIASYARVDVAALAQLIRQVDALEATIAQPTSKASQREVSQFQGPQLGWLAAARDRTESDDEQNQTDQEEPPNPEEKQS